MIIMSIYQVNAWWIWIIYIALWTAADYYFAKEVHLKWWHWAFIIALLSVIDIMVLQYFA